MPIPDFQSVMLPLLRFSSESEVSLSEATEKIAVEFNLSEEERNTLLPSNQQTIAKNRVGWAKTYLCKAGLLRSTKRGHFTITDEGKSVLQSNIERIDIKFLNKYPEFQRFHTTKGNTKDKDASSEISEENTENSPYTPEETIHNALNTIEEALGNEILTKILSLSPEFFENLVIKVFVAMGYGGSFEDAGKALGKSGDGGIDGVIDQDVLGLDRIYIQAKRFSFENNVSSSAIRDFFGSLDRVKAAKGIFVTTSDFTNDAKETAKFLSKRIVLINGRQLVKLMIRYGVGCRIEETLYIKKIDNEFFE